MRKTLFAGCVALLACGSDARSLLNTRPVIIAPFYVDATGEPVGPGTADSISIEKLAGAEKVPVLGPDGHAVTWGEFRAAGGTAEMGCGPGGTRVRLAVDHLLPNGVYTAWLVFFREPGFKAQGFDAMTGLAPVGTSDGAGAQLLVDGTGHGTLDTVVPAGTVTYAVPGRSQDIPSCLLDAYEVHIIAAYHLDGRTYGGLPGDADKIAEQIGWMVFEGRVQSL